MPAGRVLHLALLAPLLLLPAGCAPLPDDPPEPANDCTTAPRQPKTTAELLVGKWSFVTIGGRPLRADCACIVEFTSEGEMITECIRPTRPQLTSSTYTLDGNTLTLSGPVEHGPETRDLTILSISETEIVLVPRGEEAQKREHEVYKRVEVK